MFCQTDLIHTSPLVNLSERNCFHLAIGSSIPDYVGLNLTACFVLIINFLGSKNPHLRACSSHLTSTCWSRALGTISYHMIFSMLLSGFHPYTCHLLVLNCENNPTFVLLRQAQIQTSVCTHQAEGQSSCHTCHDISNCMVLKIGLYLLNRSHQPLRFHHVGYSEHMNQLWATSADGLQATRLNPPYHSDHVAFSCRCPASTNLIRNLSGFYLLLQPMVTPQLWTDIQSLY